MDSSVGFSNFKEYVSQISEIRLKASPKAHRFKSNNLLGEIMRSSSQLPQLDTEESRLRSKKLRTDLDLSPQHYYMATTFSPKDMNKYFKCNRPKFIAPSQDIKSLQIRDHNFVQELIRKCPRPQRMNQLKCPFQEGEQRSTKEIIGGYLMELKKKRKERLRQPNFSESLEVEVNAVYQELLLDRDLKNKISKCNQNLKNLIRMLLNYPNFQNIMIDKHRLRIVHLQHKVKPEQFLRFKYHMIVKLIDMNIPVEKLFQCCAKIESLKYYLMNKKLEYEVFNRQEGLYRLANLMYEKIFADYTLAPFFTGVELPVQASKFSRLFFQLIYQMDSPNYTNQALRDKHKQFKITGFQLVNFKLYLSKTLDEMKIPYTNKRQLLRRLDNYKYDIMNKDSLHSIIHSMGFAAFIEKLYKVCFQDPILHQLIVYRGKKRFVAHCENIFQYFFRMHTSAIIEADISEVHGNKCIINEQIFDKFKEKCTNAVLQLTQDRMTLMDFEEEWEEVKPIVLGFGRKEYIKELGGQRKIQELAIAIEQDLIQKQLHQIYERLKKSTCNAA